MSAVLTDNLPLLADAPNGIKKLRELILELAVRGKLVPQDPSEEPASELLKRIAEEKARLVAEEKVKKQKPLVELGDDEKPFELPQSWEWRRISDLLPEFQNGASSRGDSDGIPVTVLRLADIRAGEISLDDTRTLVLSATTVRKYALEDGDILLIRVNGSADLVGRFVVCRATLQAIPCDHFIRLRFPTGVVDSAYLKLVGDSKLARSAIAGLFVSTAGQKTVNQGHIGSLSVPLPPIAEQLRIVAKVDELMALCDRLEARQADADSAHAQLAQALLSSLIQASDAEDFAQSWQRLAEHFHTLFTTESSIDALKQTLLQLAVMGKLVPQNPSDEPASELLKRIAEEKARLVTEGKLRKPKARLEISEEEMAFSLPRGWQWVRKADVFNFLNGYAFKSEWFQQKGIRLLRNINVAHGEVDWEESACITEEQAADYQSFSLEEDDVVLTLDRPIISTGLKYAVVRRNDLPCLLLQRVAKISPYAASVTVGYLTTWLKSSFFVGAIDPGRSNGVPHISTTQVASMLFALPPLAEQHRIVAKVDQLMALCDQLKARLNQARQVHEHLASALVEQAVA
ncbi:restriction endonuclease subunit S [Pseudomonas sp. LAIL14HWK12:I7]|uniref:restriction endonuclease subunit S n=1 Tax=Pseudomonas sp. LAIL14HWK12:I7 TaxID=1259801 RepID=UPI000421E5B8|nr:restriction endonuclease subunit S [Pseudomonas sp. LAIL14HWK12:I7]